MSYTRYWILDEFYKIIEELVDVIDKSKNDKFEIVRYLQGNQSGTEIKIIISL